MPARELVVGENHTSVRPWKNGIVPYVFSGGNDNFPACPKDAKQGILDALDNIEANTSVRFVETDYVLHGYVALGIVNSGAIDCVSRLGFEEQHSKNKSPQVATPAHPVGATPVHRKVGQQAHPEVAVVHSVSHGYSSLVCTLRTRVFTRNRSGSGVRNNFRGI